MDKKIALITGLFLLTSLSAWASPPERAGGWCEEGNQVVTTNGSQSTTKVQRSYPQCTVTVFFHGTTTVAPIFSDNIGTPLANPFVASTAGYWFFYANDSLYDVQLSGSSFSTPYTIGAVRLFSYLTPGSFNAVCDGTTDDTAALQALVAGANGGTVHFTQPCVLKANLTFPSTLAISFDSGGSISVASGDTLTLNSPISSGPYHIFQGSGTVVFGPTSAITTIYPQWWGAAGDGVTNDSVAVQDALNAASNISTLFPKGTYAVCNITLANFSKIDMNGSLLVPTSGCADPILNVNTQDPLQSTDKRLLNRVRIDCQSSATSPGGLFIGAATAELSTQDIQVSNCSTGYGVEFFGTQFSENYNMQVFGNEVGLKMVSSPTAGGGSSNTFYGLEAINNQVGYFQYNTVFIQNQNVFINPNMLDNFICASAQVGPSDHIPQTTLNSLIWYGGAPEANATSSDNSIVIDGYTIPKTTIYVSSASITLNDVGFADAQALVEITAVNDSIVNLNNPSGYGVTGGTFVSSDSTSFVTESGVDRTIAKTQRVTTYPDAFYPFSSKTVYGAGVYKLTDRVLNTYTGNPLKPSFSDINGSISQQIIDDPIFGNVNSVTHNAIPGSGSNNRVNLGVVIPSQGVASDYFISVLVRSNVACSYNVVDASNAVGSGVVSLPAGQWTRIVMVVNNKTAAINLIGFPTDSTGPTVEWTAIETLAAPTGTLGTATAYQDIVHDGAVNPNGNIISHSGLNYTAPSFTFSAPTSAPSFTSTIATGTPPFTVTSTTPVANLYANPKAYLNTGTQFTSTHLVKGQAALDGASPSKATVTLSGLAVYGSLGSYGCWVNDAASPPSALSVSEISASQFTIFGPNGSTTLVFYLCFGN